MNLNLENSAKLHLIYPAMLTVFLCLGCEELVDFPLIPDHVPIPVIEAILTDQPEKQWVRVSESVGINDSLTCSTIEDAMVRIISEAGDTVFYDYQANGWYVSPVFAALPGMGYTLEVSMHEITYRSSGEVVALGGLDSVYYRYLPETGVADSAYYVFFDAGRAFPSDTRYYVINAYRNQELLTHGSELWIFNDKYVQTVNNLKLPTACHVNDTMHIELCSLSRDMFDYYRIMYAEMFSVDISNISYRTNLPQLFEPAALGYFQVSAVSRRAIVIKTSE
jgi:hypothetical protein